MAVAPFFAVSRTLPSGAKRFIVRFLNPDGSMMRSTTLQYADFSKLPKAGLIFVTHEHGDHLDPTAIDSLRKPDTRIIPSEASRAKLGSGEALEHGRAVQAAGISVEAVPAYNSSAGRTGYHPRNGRTIISLDRRIRGY